jgi:broad specificity phosphatase PhoE
MRAIFIRHGQSTGNVGIPCHDLALVELTELGKRQGREIAESWTEPPDLIVVSPYLRTQQTAAATIERFPNVPVRIWPIQEFTYLQPSRWSGTLNSERMPHVERYWARADPWFCDGESAESFATMLDRAGYTLGRLETLPAGWLVYVFSHGQFIQAVRSLIIDAGLTEQERMGKFWGQGSPAIANAERIELRRESGGWKYVPAKTPQFA